MKTRILILIYICFTTSGFSQIVPSSCKATDSIIQKYFTDAQRLALRRILSSGSNYADSTHIPAAWTDTSLNALIAVYNATSLPARDTVVALLNIHTWYNPVMNSMLMEIDTSYAWANQLSQGNLNTENAVVDELIDEHGLTISDIYFWPWGVNVLFSTDSNYNLIALCDEFEAVPGVVYSEINGVFGDGADITDNVTPDFVTLIYSYGWGDCPAGCIFNRFWEFNIYYDCSVEFVGSYGDLIDFAVGSGEAASGLHQIKIYR